MSSCAANITDEKKEDEMQVDWSLKNVFAFSTGKKQMAEISREGLVSVNDDGSRDDRRNKVILSDEKFAKISYYSLCQITATVTKGKGLGSCTGLGIDGKRAKVYWYLSCAHNLVCWNAYRQKFVPYKNGEIFVSRQGEKVAYKVNKVDHSHVVIHPKYDNRAECGFDICLVPVCLETFQNIGFNAEIKKSSKKDGTWRDVETKPAKAKDIVVGMTVELAGYPGEKGGWPYTHEGKIRDVTETKLGGYILWYDADATPGNSGSCIMITDPNFLKKYSSNPKVKKIIVGVHTGHDENENLNFGTLITPKMFKWIKRHIK